MSEENVLVYPVTASFAFAGAAPEVVNFETVEQWQHAVESKLDGAMRDLRMEIVPRDENKTHRDMFTAFSILFKFERTGKAYGSVTSQMHMPVPARTMLQ